MISCMLGHNFIRLMNRTQLRTFSYLCSGISVLRNLKFFKYNNPQTSKFYSISSRKKLKQKRKSTESNHSYWTHNPMIIFDVFDKSQVTQDYSDSLFSRCMRLLVIHEP